MEEQIDQIRFMAEKSLIYNTDINQHIISCRISLVIINEQQQLITELSNKIRIDEEKNKTIEIQKKIIEECYKVIKELN